MRGVQPITWCALSLALACTPPSAPPREQPAPIAAKSAAPSRASTTSVTEHATETQLEVSEAAHADDFAPPDANGWGSAAGLRYLSVMRGGAQPGDAVPMLIAIHGLGDRPRPDWFADLDVPARLVLPQAPMPYHGGFAWFEYRLADRDPQALARGIAKATEQLARAIGLLASQLPTQGKPVVCGFSQGGMLSYALALGHPSLFSVAVPISGMLPEPAWPSAPQAGTRYPPIRALHGDADDVVPFATANALVTHLQAQGFDAALQRYPGIRHTITPAMWQYAATQIIQTLTQPSGGTSR